MADVQEKLTIDRIDKAMQRKEADISGIKWYSPMEPPFRLAGFPWISGDKLYRRLPAGKDLNIPRFVDILADCTAGGQISFRTNSSKLILKAELAGAANMDHMPATGQCGFDCYLGKPGSQLYCSTVRHDQSKSSYEYQLFDMAYTEIKDVLLNFPLYQGVKEVWIGLENGAEVLEPLPYAMEKPLVFYGTSITQGGCASRPGMAYTNILSRRLNLQVINLGFSGNGKGEPEVASVITGIPDPACFVLDYEGNADTGGILEKTLPGFIEILRERHPSVPFLVVSKIRYARENFNREALDKLIYLRDFQKNLVDELRKKGDANVHFCSGMDLLGDHSHEFTVDGVHPTDLGFWMMAERLEPVVRSLVLK